MPSIGETDQPAQQPQRSEAWSASSRSSMARRHKILHNRVYLGDAVHKGTPHPGEHEAIIDRTTWDKVHAILAENTVARANDTRAQTPTLLRGEGCRFWSMAQRTLMRRRARAMRAWWWRFPSRRLRS